MAFWLDRLKRNRKPSVVVADTAFAKDEHVREVLEANGFHVVSEPPAAGLLAEVARRRPDVVVIEDELAADRPPDTIASIRATSPYSKILVPSEGGRDLDLGADAYVAKTKEGLPGAVRGLVEARAEEVQALPPAARAVSPETRVSGRMEWGTSKLVAVAVGVALVATGIVAWPRGSLPLPTPGHGGPKASGSQTSGTTSVTLALGDLKDVAKQLRARSYGFALVSAKTLMHHRDEAKKTGYSLKKLDAQIAATLRPLVGKLPARVVVSLKRVLGNLMPHGGTH